MPVTAEEGPETILGATGGRVDPAFERPLSPFAPEAYDPRAYEPHPWADDLAPWVAPPPVDVPSPWAPPPYEEGRDTVRAAPMTPSTPDVPAARTVIRAPRAPRDEYPLVGLPLAEPSGGSPTAATPAGAPPVGPGTAAPVWRAGHQPPLDQRGAIVGGAPRGLADRLLGRLSRIGWPDRDRATLLVLGGAFAGVVVLTLVIMVATRLR